MRDRRIPEIASAIVLKLMANSPDHRYQTADGVAHDLLRVAQELAESGSATPFKVATRDWEDRVRKPSRLFGRERESAVLSRALGEACEGAVVLALVAGPSGVGKSALVGALREQIRARQGLFAPGKFDQLKRSMPYSALAEALRAVVRRRLADPAKTLARFQKAWQEAAGSNAQSLGLTITRRLVELMRGMIEVESEPGVGTVFTVTLPVPIAGVGAAAGLASDWDEISGYEGVRRAILVVDDNLENRSFLRDLLAPLGFEVTEAESGERALALVRERAPDIIFMDLAMRDMDGYETTQRLRGMPELGNAVIVASSASVGETERERSLRAGFDAFLPKPMDVKALFEVLRRSLSLTWTRRPAEGAEGANAPPEGALTAPPAADLARLIELADRGLMRKLSDELKRIEERSAELKPWVDHVRGLVQGFQMRQLRKLLRAEADAAS